MTSIALIVAAFSLALPAVTNLAGPAYPTKTYGVIQFALAVVTIGLTLFSIPLYTLSPWVVAPTLLLLAVASPVVGLWESTLRGGDAVYCAHGPGNRFPEHLRNNLLGAAAALAFWGVAHSVPAAAMSLKRAFGDKDVVVNVVLPLCAATAFVFVRWQQSDAVKQRSTRSIDELEEAARPRKIVGFSLDHWHQRLNVLHLVCVTSVVGTSFVMLVTFGMQSTRDAHADLSWPVVLAIAVTLGFLYSCGVQRSERQSRAVYLTFLTGAPAAIGAAILWLSWFNDSPARRATMVGVAAIGYVLWCALAIRDDLARSQEKQRPPLHYFAPMTLAIAIAMLLGAVYFQP